MASRREFLRSGAALSALSVPPIAALAAAPGAAAAVGTATAGELHVERFVLDTRFREAVEVARYVALRDVPLTEISGDLTNLWYDDFDLRWKAAPMVLAGVTSWHGLFVLETLAADRGMRVVYRGEHRAPQGGCVAHVLSGPAALIARATAASGASAWEAPLGRALARCPVGDPAAVRLELTTSAEPLSTRTQTLYSWIIAPRSAAAPGVRSTRIEAGRI